MFKKIDLFEVPMKGLTALRKEIEIRQYPDGRVELHMPNAAKDALVHLLTWSEKDGWRIG